MPQLDLIRRILKAALATGAPSRAEFTQERYGQVGTKPTTANERVILTDSVATAWTEKLGGDLCTLERPWRILTRDRSIHMSYAMNEDAAIELARRNVARFNISFTCSRWEVDRLIKNLKTALPSEAPARKALHVLSKGSPIIDSGCWIGCDVRGPLYLSNIHLRNGGLITGCGAIVLSDTTPLPAGSLVVLRGGQLVTTPAELESLVVGNLFHDPAALN